MSSQNVKLVQRAYAFFASVAWPRAKAGEDVSSDRELAAIFQSDIVIEEIAEFPDADRYHGYEGMVTWLEGWADIYERMRITPQEFIPAGDHVVVPTHQWFRSNTGLETEQDITHLWTVRDGRIAYVTGYRDKSKALEAAGLPPTGSTRAAAGQDQRGRNRARANGS
jgi:ketosteroid isomerase-like protein